MTNRPAQAAPAPIRTRSRGARRVLAAVATLGALVLVLHLPVVQRLLTPVLQHALSVALGGEVTVGSLGFNLWTGRVHGTDLRLVRPGLEVTGAALEVHVRPWRGLVVRATEPRLVVSLASDTTPAPPDQRPWTVLERVAAIEVVRGALRVQSADGARALQIEALDARASRDEGSLTATVVARTTGVRRPEYEWREAVDARLDLDVPDATGTVHVRSAAVTVGDARVLLTGELQQLNPVIGRAHVEIPAGMSLLRTLVPDAVLDGEIAARAEVVADRSGLRATMVADATALRLAHVGPWDGRLEGHVEGGVLRVDDIDLAAYGGRLRGQGAVSLDGATSEFRASLRGIDLPRVLTSHTSLTTRIASRADADLSLRMSRWDRRTLIADGTVTLRPVAGPGIPLRGSARFSADDRHVRLSTAALRVHETDLQVRGTIGFDGRLNLHYGARLADVSRVPDVLARVGVDVPRLNVRGSLEAEGSVNGVPERWAATARLSGRSLAIENLDLDVDSELRMTPTSLTLVFLTARGVDGAVSASGDIPMGQADAWRIAGSVERLRLDDVLVRRGVPFEASARGRFEVTGRRSAPEMAMTLEADVSSRAASITGTPAAPVLVEASARASYRGVVVDRFRASGSLGAVEGTGRWSAGSNDIEAHVRAAEFPLTAIPGVPALPGLHTVLTGELEISGALPVPAGRGDEVTGRRSAPDVAVTLQAGLSARAAAAPGPPVATVLVDASARASNRGVVVDRLRARGGAGGVEGSGRWSAESGVVEARIRSSEFPLTAIPGVPALPGLESVLTGELTISGTLPGPTGRGPEVTGTRPVPDVAITLDAGVFSRAVATPGPPTATLLVEASARASNRAVFVDRFHARGGAGGVEGSGRWSAESGDVEARVRSSAFPLTAIPGVPPLLDVESLVTGELEISGTLPALTGRGSVSATSTVWRGAPFPDLRVDLSSDGREVTLQGSIAQRPWLMGRMPLVAPWPLRLDIDLAALPMVEFMRAVPELARRDASATASGRALVDVELGAPSHVRYQLNIDGAEGSFTQPWRTGPFSVRGTLHELSVQDLEMRFGVGRLRIDGQVGLAHEATSRLTIAGAAPLSHLVLVTPLEEADGEALVDVTLSGSLARPSWAGTVRVANGLIRQGALRIDDVELIAAMDARGVDIRQASARVAGGRVYGTGALALQQEPSDRHRLELHARGIDVARLMPAPDSGPTVTAVVDADLRVSSDRLALDAVQADGALTSLVVSASGRTLSLETPVAVSISSGTLTHAPLRLAGSAGHVTLESVSAFVSGQAHLAARIDGEVDLIVARPLLGDVGTLTGLARMQGRVERDASGWHARGEAQVNIARLAFTDPAVVVSDLTATLRGEGERIEVVEGSARVGDGKVSLTTGRLLLSSAGAEVDLVLRADRVPLEYPAGLRTRSSGDFRFTGRSGAFRLAGDVVVHRAISELEDARAAPGIDRVSATLAAFKGRGSLRDRTALDLRLRLEDGLRLATPQISLVVDGAVRVGGTLLAPEINGSLTFREGGTVRVSRALVRLEAGRVELSGYPARQPEVEVRGATQVSGVGIDVSLSGPLDDVRMTLSARNRSDLGQGDLATLILTGRTTSAAASESGAILAEELASSLGRVLNRQLGGFVMLDVSRDETLIPENTNSSLRMNIGIPLGNRLYVIYSQGLDTGTQRWIVDVRPGGDFRLRVISNEDGSEAVEVSHRFGFDVWSRRLRPPVVRVRPRIGSITVVGTSSREEAQVRSRLRLGPGDEFDFFRSQDAARAAQDWFIAQGFLEAVVDTHHQTTAAGSVDLTVHVVRGPLVQIEWRGDDPGRSLRRHVTSGWNSILPRDERAARLAREVRRTLQGSRFYAAAVTATVTEVPAKGDQVAEAVRVTFDVSRGPRGSGVDLRFEGNASVPGATLAAALPPRNSAAFFALIEPDGSRRLAAALLVAYATEGFLDMRVGTPRESFAGGGERLTVTIPIVEGDRALVVALELPEAARAVGATIPALALRDGTPFRFDAYTADRARLLAWLREEGHPEARVASVLEPAPGGLAVRFYADPGPRVTMGVVRTARDGRTRPSIIENAVGTSPGDVIRASSLDEARRQLTDARVFRSVDLRLAPVDGREDVRDVVVDVVERSDINVEYSLRYTTAGQAQVGGAPSETQAGLQFGAGVELVNPFGGADRYRVSRLRGTERQLLNVRYDRATFFGWHVPTEVFLYDDRQRLADVQGLAQRVTGATFEQSRSWRSGLDGRRLHDRLRMQWGYTIRRIDYAGITPFGSTLNGLRAGLIHSLVGDTRDSVTDPHRGVMWSVGSELALEGLGSDVNYYRTFGQLHALVPLHPRLTWAQGYRIGVVPGDDPLLLLDSRFFAGGASSVRGFAERSLGPRTLEGEALGGQASAIINQELRFPLWKRVHGGIFYDAGNAFALARDLDLLDLRHSAGVGLRLMFPFGPVRLEWAHVLGRRAGETPSRFVFGIGHAF